MIPLQIDGIKEGLYYIKEDGSIYSKAKKDYLIPRSDKDGYLYVQLQKTNGGRNNRICKRIASLVILTFKGNPPNDMNDPTINHIDGNILNNHISNLEWIERGLNSSIRKNKGQGIQNHEAKLNDETVREICELLYNTELSLQEIANKYEVDKSTISNIVRQKNWKHISSQYDFSGRTSIRDVNGRYKTYNARLHQGERK